MNLQDQNEKKIKLHDQIDNCSNLERCSIVSQKKKEKKKEDIQFMLIIHYH